VLGPGRLESLAALDDSKKLTEKVREKLFPLICRYALAYHVVFIPSGEVDRRGVHVANIEGMRRAVAGLSVRPGYVLSDGFRVPGLPMPSLPVVGGDGAAACIAAASVLAKVSRDRLMVAMDADHPGYGFAEHKGYGTPAHSLALTRLGPCAEHRYSFINVRRVAIGSEGSNTRVVAECKPDPPGLGGEYS
jgi:ribonuclease HII